MPGLPEITSFPCRLPVVARHVGNRSTHPLHLEDDVGLDGRIEGFRHDLAVNGSGVGVFIGGVQSRHAASADGVGRMGVNPHRHFVLVPYRGANNCRHDTEGLESPFVPLLFGGEVAVDDEPVRPRRVLPIHLTGVRLAEDVELDDQAAAPVQLAKALDGGLRRLPGTVFRGAEDDVRLTELVTKVDAERHCVNLCLLGQGRVGRAKTGGDRVLGGQLGTVRYEYETDLHLILLR